MMLRKILIYGVIAGAICGVPLSAMIVLTRDALSSSYGMVIGYTSMLIALSAVFVAIKRHRDVEGGGVIRFWTALGIGLGVSVVAGIVYVIAWESTVALAHYDFVGSYSRAMIAHEKAAGASGAALAKITAEMAAFKATYDNPLYRLPMIFSEIFPVGVLVSLVSAALLRNPRFLPLRRDGGVA